MRCGENHEIKDKGEDLSIPVCCPSGCKKDDRLVDKRIEGGIKGIIQEMKTMRPLKLKKT